MATLPSEKIVHGADIATIGEQIKSKLSSKQDTIQDLSEIRSGAAKGATAYQKPSAGIPSSDMTSAVQNSLELAVGSLQKTAQTLTAAEKAQVWNNLGIKEGVSKVVSTLPTTEIDENIVYLVPTANAGEFTEYKYNGSSWDNLGTFTVPAPTVVNDLETGGSTSALSAEMGKVLDGKIGQLEAKVNGNKAVIDLSAFTVYGGIINDGFWGGVTAPTRYQHIFIPVSPCEKFTIQNQLPDDLTVKFAYLTAKDENPVNSGTPDFCQGYTIEETLSNGSTVNVTMPVDCAYLYVTIMSNYKTVPVIRYNEESEFDKLEERLNGTIDVVKENTELYLQGTTVHSTYGTYVDNSSYSATQKISVSENDVITTEENIYRVAEYNGTTFKGLVVNGGKTYTVPSAVTHIVLVFNASDSSGYIYINGKSANGIFVRDNIETIDARFVELAKENPIYYFGKNINSGTGAYSDNANCFTTLDIPVQENDVITCDRDMYRVSEYGGGSFIRLAVNETNSYTVPNGVESIRIVFLLGIPTALYLNGIRVNATVLQNLEGADQTALNAHISDHNNPHQVTKEQLGIGMASTTVAGLLSPIDKAKIDTLQYSINISGSGIAKNASAFGFLPSATADENNLALQSAVNGGGTILVDVPGVYDLSGNIVLPSNTKIVFGANTYVRKCANGNNVVAKYMFINEGASTRTLNENITIIGLHIYTNGKSGNGGITILGLRGHIALFYVKNVLLKDITITDSTQLYDFNIHICTFENVVIDGVKIDSFKDGLHFGNGKNLYINNCVLSTADDPIALNAYDYVSGNPELGWLENIHISNIVLNERQDKNGRPIEIIGGGWSDWASGNEYQSQGDTVIYDGKLFRTNGPADGATYTASVPPASSTIGQNVTGADGITWVLMQESEIYDCGVKNLYVNNFVVRHGGSVLFNISYEISASYCRSYYPGSENYGIHENLYFDSAICEKKIDRILNVTAPVRNVKVSNSILNATYLGYYQNYKGGTNPSSEASLLVVSGNSFPMDLASMRLDTYDRDIKLKTYGNMPINPAFTLGKMARVTVVSTDI